MDIEKKGSNFQFTINSKADPREDSVELASEFAAQDKFKIDSLLPDHAVKIGESWNVKPDILKAFGDEMAAGIDSTKSRLNARLARAYTQDGQQWGSIAFDFGLVPKSAAETMKVAGTFDLVIDGSTRTAS